MARLLTRPTPACRDTPCPSKAAGEQEPEAYPQWYTEDSCEPRTKPGERRVSTRRGWAGENSDIFSILLVRRREHRNDAQRPAGPTGNLHRQGDHIESPFGKIS